MDVLNPRGVTNFWSLQLNYYDVVVIHYSLCVLFESYLPRTLKRQLAAFHGLKVQFIQDDYRWVDSITTVMREIGVDVLLTLVPEDQIPKIWTGDRLPGIAAVPTLAGYVPERLVGLQTAPLRSRPIDIGYRGRVLPYWLGRIGQEKAWIAQGVMERAAHYGLRCDIGWREEDRLYGARWDQFLSSCKATLGTESGATITDFDGSIERAVRAYIACHPEACFDEVYEQILRPYEGNVRMNVISPKIFEAIALHTALILFRGEYSGVLTPWAHYIPLEKDFSNMAEVVDCLRDADGLQAMADRAYADIVASGGYSYRAFMQHFDDLIEAQVARSKSLAGKRYHTLVGGARTMLPKMERGLRIRLSRVQSRAAHVFAKLQHLVSHVVAVLLFRMKGESLLVLKAAMRRPILWTLLSRCISDPQRRRSVSLRHLLKEIMLLGVAEEISGDESSAGRPFILTITLQLDEGRVSIKSVPSQPVQDGLLPPATPKFDSEAASQQQWSRFYEALQNGRLKELAWDHSAVGVYVPYRIAGIGCVGIGVGEDGIRTFVNLIEVARGTD